MPKHGFLTPKAIANRIKAKGLQKLRWYCQMCQKQCRDENGFKCHTMSESHQRQLLLFAENPDKYIDSFSQEFLDNFMDLVKRRFGTKRVQANQVYQEYVADRDHTHMNATQWETLTDFVKWLGREGHCNVDYTEKGWFIAYIDKDPETIKRQEALLRKEKMDLDDEDRIAKFVQKQIERGKDQLKEKGDIVYTEIMKEKDEKVQFQLKQSSAKDPPDVKSKSNPLIAHTSKEAACSSKREKKSNDKKRALDEIIEEQETVKEKRNRKDYWLVPGIIVKIITKRLGDSYYKKKAIVKEVKDKYAGIVKVIETGTVLKLDQSHVETVIPAIGREVFVVNGAYRGQRAVLVDINMEKFCVKIEIKSGPLRGRMVSDVAYEDVCKLHPEK